MGLCARSNWEMVGPNFNRGTVLPKCFNSWKIGNAAFEFIFSPLANRISTLTRVWDEISTAPGNIKSDNYIG